MDAKSTRGPTIRLTEADNERVGRILDASEARGFRARRAEVVRRALRLGLTRLEEGRDVPETAVRVRHDGGGWIAEVPDLGPAYPPVRATAREAAIGQACAVALRCLVERAERGETVRGVRFVVREG